MQRLPHAQVSPFAAGLLAGAFIGGKAAGAVMTGSVAAGIQAQLHYSRNDERQADQLGFKPNCKIFQRDNGLMNPHPAEFRLGLKHAALWNSALRIPWVDFELCICGENNHLVFGTKFPPLLTVRV
jgi:hypothetical protein